MLLGLGAGGTLAVVGVASRAESAPPPMALIARMHLALPKEPKPKAVPAPQLANPEPTRVPVLTAQEFEQALSEDVARIGSVSIGAANRGNLFNATPMPESPLWILAEPKCAYGTEETVQALSHAITEVNRLFPETPPIYIGHIGKERGGWLRPHRSHQSGRDVDLGFYYRGESRWYLRATESNFDVERNWALLSALLKTTSVEYVFIDQSLQGLLRAEAMRVGESPALVRDAFDGIPGKTQPLVRHVRGHDQHMHVRLMSSVAVTNALRLRGALGRKAGNRAALLSMLTTRSAKQRKR